jgi:hypothetical protein
VPRRSSRSRRSRITGPEHLLYRPESEFPRPSRPIAYASPFLSILGLNVHRRDREAEAALWLRGMERHLEAQRQTQRRAAGIYGRPVVADSAPGDGRGRW